MRNRTESKSKEREVSLDVIRIAAFLLVPSVHFFLHSGFQDEPVCGAAMCVMTVIDSLCLTCVPLFLLLTGFLESRREIPVTGEGLLHFYGRLIGIYCIYLLVSLLVLLFRTWILDERLGGWGSLEAIFGFQHYSWYVEMYLGLALLIPFLNVLWRALPGRAGHRALLAVLVLLTVTPSVTDMLGRSLLPDWWKGLYPITYYCIGAYLQRYDAAEADGIRWIGSRRSSGRLLLLFLVCGMLGGLYAAARNYGSPLQSGDWNDWGSLTCTADAVLLFQLVRSRDYSRMTAGRRRLLSRIASLTFAAYLLSWLPDHVLYPILLENVPQMAERFVWFLPIVSASILISLALAALLEPIADQLAGGIKRLARKLLRRGML